MEARRSIAIPPMAHVGAFLLGTGIGVIGHASVIGLILTLLAAMFNALALLVGVLTITILVILLLVFSRLRILLALTFGLLVGAIIGFVLQNPTGGV